MTFPVNSIMEWGSKVGYSKYCWRMIRRQLVKRILRKDLAIMLPNGKKLLLPTWSGFSGVVWVTKGHADNGCEEIMESFSNPSQSFIDVGAHFGYWALRMAHCSESVIAIEPNPICKQILNRNLSEVQSQVFSIGVSNKDAELPFFADASPPYSKFFDEEFAIDRDGNFMSLEVRTIDSLWCDLAKKNFWGIKIDTEGHESAIISGSKELINQCRPVILMETTREALTETSQILDKFDYVYFWFSLESHDNNAGLFWGDGEYAVSEFPEGMIFTVPKYKFDIQKIRHILAGYRIP